MCANPSLQYVLAPPPDLKRAVSSFFALIKISLVFVGLHLPTDNFFSKFYAYFAYMYKISVLSSFLLFLSGFV